MIYNTAMTDTNPIRIDYSDACMRVLVEEYITQQRSAFTFKGVCSYVLYWAMEDGKVADQGTLCEGNELPPYEQERIKRILAAIVKDGRIAATGIDAFTKILNA